MSFMVFSRSPLPSQHRLPLSRSLFRRFSRLASCALLALLPLAFAAHAQRRPMDVPSPTHTDIEPTRTRLILKDGSFQYVFSYKVVGNIVRYRSAERDGAEEDIPLDLVDLPATELWKKEHTPGYVPPPQTPVLTPELARQEAARAALTPEVAPDLRLPEEDSVLALDTFRATPELIPLPQNGSDLNKETAHAVSKGPINPASAPHRILDVPRERSDIQLHVPDPVFFVRISGGQQPDATGGAFTVDTHGANNRSALSAGAPGNGYVIQRVDVRRDARVVDSFRLGLLGSGRNQPDIIETRAETLPGGNWLKLTPAQPLEFGEYVLIEVLAPNAVNLDVWDFGVHSDAPENAEAIRPEPKRPPALERRRQP